MARALSGRGLTLALSDDKMDPATLQTLAAELGAQVWPVDPALVAQAAAITPAPGIRPEHPVRAAAQGAGKVVGDVEWLARLRPERLLCAITGTNGKSTITALIAHLLGVAPSGNIGRAAGEAIAEVDTGPLVVEVSSFQAELVATVKPKVGIYANLAPDHFDRYPDLAAYHAAKGRLFERMGLGDTLIVGAGIPTDWLEDRRRAGVEVVEVAESDDPLLGSGFENLPLQLIGRPNRWNVAVAILAARQLGLDEGVLTRRLLSFEPLPHRMVPVAQTGSRLCVDDSKATNVHAAAAALRGWARGAGALWWIVGGLAKEYDFLELAAAAQGLEIHPLYFGKDGPRIAAQLQPLLGGEVVADMAAALDRVSGEGAVLLSPACASFDLYTSFGQRGDHFADLCRQRFGAPTAHRVGA